MMANFSDLLGKTLVSVERIDGADGDEILYTTDAGSVYRQYHYQDCCETVRVEDVAGNLGDLIGTPLTLAEEVSNGSVDTPYGDEQWTFYKLATVNGYVTIRWYGTSNGYYSTAVSFEQVA